MPLVLRKEVAYKKKLAERAATASKLYFEENKSRNEIATALGVSLSTVDKVLRSIPDYKAKQKRSTISDETRQKVVELYRQGFSAPSIAEHLGGFVGATAYNIVRKLAPELITREASNTRSGRAIPDEKRAIIIKLYNDGVPNKEIAAQAGVAVSTVYNVSKELPAEQRRLKQKTLIPEEEINPDDVKGTVIKLHEDYHSIEEIAAKLEIPKTQVELIISTHRHSLK